MAPVALFRILSGFCSSTSSGSCSRISPRSSPTRASFPGGSSALFDPERLSLLNLVGDWWLVAVIWAFSCIVALALTLGWHTSVVCFLAFASIVTFQWRNPLILDGSDLVFRFVPLWLDVHERGRTVVARRAAASPGGDRSADGRYRCASSSCRWRGSISRPASKSSAGVVWVGGTAAYYALQLEHTFGALVGTTHRAAAAPREYDQLVHLAVELGVPSTRDDPLAPGRASIAAIAARRHALRDPHAHERRELPASIMLAACVLFVPPTWIRGSIDRTHGALKGERLAQRADLALVSSQRILPPLGRSCSPNFCLADRSAALVTVRAVVARGGPTAARMLRHRAIRGLVRLLSLDQRWDMFSPDSARADGWMLAPGDAWRTARRLDLLVNGGPVDERSERYSDPLYTRWSQGARAHRQRFYAGLSF